MMVPENRGNRTQEGRFPKGVSGNPGGRPKGAKTIAYNVHQMYGEALDDATRANAIRELRANLSARRSVVGTLESAARLSKEIGLGSGEAPTGVTIIFESNIRPRAPRPGPGIGPMSDSGYRSEQVRPR